MGRGTHREEVGASDTAYLIRCVLELVVAFVEACMSIVFLWTISRRRRGIHSSEVEQKGHAERVLDEGKQDVKGGRERG